jgi:hypothetical protein
VVNQTTRESARIVYGQFFKESESTTLEGYLPIAIMVVVIVLYSQSLRSVVYSGAKPCQCGKYDIVLRE